MPGYDPDDDDEDDCDDRRDDCRFLSDDGDGGDDGDDELRCVLGERCLVADPFHRSDECFDQEWAEAYFAEADSLATDQHSAAAQHDDRPAPADPELLN